MAINGLDAGMMSMSQEKITVPWENENLLLFTFYKELIDACIIN